MISRIIMVEVGIINRSRRLRLITLTDILIILDITKTECNNGLNTAFSTKVVPQKRKSVRDNADWYYG